MSVDQVYDEADVAHVNELKGLYYEAQAMRDDVLNWKHQSAASEALYVRLKQMCDRLNDMVNDALESLRTA